jgi:hypothetical protein
MPSRSEKIKTRFVEFDPWNHRLRVALFLPVFYVLGYATAILAMAPLRPSSPTIVGAIGGGIGVLLGCVPLALVD